MALWWLINAMWFCFTFILCILMSRQNDRHTAERELWRAERQILQARALRPAPSARRPELAPQTGINEAKLAELKRIADRAVTPFRPEEPRGHIVPTDL